MADSMSCICLRLPSASARTAFDCSFTALAFFTLFATCSDMSLMAVDSASMEAACSVASLGLDLERRKLPALIRRPLAAQIG